MNRGKLKNRVCRVISFGLVLVTVCSMTVGAESIPEDESWREKIDAELWEEMEGKSEEDLIPVYLWPVSYTHLDVYKRHLCGHRKL